MNNTKQKEIFANNLKKWLTKTNKSQSDIVETLNISASTVSDWCTAKKFPRIDKIELLATFFNIHKSDLIEDFSASTAASTDMLTVCIPLLRKYKNNP